MQHYSGEILDNLVEMKSKDIKDVTQEPEVGDSIMFYNEGKLDTKGLAIITNVNRHFNKKGYFQFQIMSYYKEGHRAVNGKIEMYLLKKQIK